MKSPLRILIVGTGRCGTGWLADALSKSQISCGHEAIFNHWSEEKVKKNYMSSGYAAESAWPAAPFIGRPWFDSTVKVVHMVRNPRDVVKSFYDLNFFSSDRVAKPLNQIVYKNTSITADSQDRLSSAVQHYIEWNRLIEQRLENSDNPNILIRFESLLSSLDDRERLQSFLGKRVEFEVVRVNEKTTEKEAEQGADFAEILAERELLKLSRAGSAYGYANL